MKILRATLALAEGVAAIEFPDRLSAESFEDLKDWMELMLHFAERVTKRTEQEAERGCAPPVTAGISEGGVG